MSLTGLLPPSLDLPPHLSAQKYFMVCTLTVAAWDTLVLTPRSLRLFRTHEWPLLKILYHFMQVFMPVEFTVVAVAFFDTQWSQATCQRFFLFEPICTAILLAAASTVHVIRIYAIYDKNKNVLFGLGSLLAIQIVVTAVCCGFYRSVPLDVGQGCIAGPRHNWIGIYWLAPTLLYTASLCLAFARSFNSLEVKPLTKWKLMLRDGLNLYGAIWIVNMGNMLFWFIMKPTGEDDPIKTIVTSMAAVITTSMTLRIVLSVRGPLAYGGSFALSASTSAKTSSSRTTHVISTGRSNAPTNISSHPTHTYTIDNMHTKPEAEWVDGDGKSSVNGKATILPIRTDSREGDENEVAAQPNLGVKVTVDREVDYQPYPREK